MRYESPAARCSHHATVKSFSRGIGYRRVSQYSGIPGSPWTKSKIGLVRSLPLRNIPSCVLFTCTRVFSEMFLSALDRKFGDVFLAITRPWPA